MPPGVAMMAAVLHRDRRRAGSFGADPERYDRVRPGYPAALYDELLAERVERVLDVGCGTGKASGPLAARGCRVLGVEPDARMAAVARRNGLDVEVAPFEAWDPAGRTFDLVVAGQAWHWVDPAAGSAKAAAVLVPGGRVALFWNVGRHDERTAEVLDAVYAAAAPDLGPSPPGGADVGHAVAGLVATGRFDEPDVRSHPWERAYTTAEWIDQLRTHSDHRVLPDGVRAGLLAAVAAAVDRLGGIVPMSYECVVVTARRR